MQRVWIIAVAMLSVGTPVAAQAPIEMPVTEVLSLVAQPFLDQSAFERALITALPGVQIEADSVAPPILDPFLWAFSGSFGPNGDRPVPGAIFACARYGLGTRELFAQQGFSSRDSFVLMGQVMPQPDDPDVWPEGAVARLLCSFVWDDERVVWILDEAPARAALDMMFERVLPGAEQTDVPGYRLDATGGPEDSVSQVESAAIVLTQGHQSVMIRSFLMGGGF